MRLMIIAALVACGTTPALAQTAPVFGGFMEQAVTGQFASDASFEKRDVPRVGLIQTGGFDIELEVTPMAAVIETFGGTLNQQGEAGGHVVWICYTIGTDWTVWFYSDGEMGDGAVTGFAGELGKPNPAWGCTQAPMTLSYMQFDAPGISAHVTELDAAFLPVVPDAEGRVGYTSESPHPRRAGFSIVQDVVYRLSPEGITTAVAVVQMTGD